MAERADLQDACCGEGAPAERRQDEAQLTLLWSNCDKEVPMNARDDDLNYEPRSRASVRRRLIPLGVAVVLFFCAARWGPAGARAISLAIAHIRCEQWSYGAPGPICQTSNGFYDPASPRDVAFVKCPPWGVIACVIDPMKHYHANVPLDGHMNSSPDLSPTVPVFLHRITRRDGAGRLVAVFLGDDGRNGKGCKCIVGLVIAKQSLFSHPACVSASDAILESTFYTESVIKAYEGYAGQPGTAAFTVPVDLNDQRFECHGVLGDDDLIRWTIDSPPRP